jgi:hypothetical protein
LFVRIGRHKSGQDALKMLASVSGVASVEPYGEGYIISAKRRADVRPALSAAVVGHGMDLLELRPLAVTLEDIFLELTTRLGEDSSRRGG